MSKLKILIEFNAWSVNLFLNCYNLSICKRLSSCRNINKRNKFRIIRRLFFDFRFKRKLLQNTNFPFFLYLFEQSIYAYASYITFLLYNIYFLYFHILFMHWSDLCIAPFQIVENNITYLTYTWSLIPMFIARNKLSIFSTYKIRCIFGLYSDTKKCKI